jgi:hypothetical protein
MTYLLLDLTRKAQAVDLAKADGKGLLYRAEKGQSIRAEVLRTTRKLNVTIGNNDRFAGVHTLSSLDYRSLMDVIAYYAKVYQYVNLVNPVMKLTPDQWNQLFTRGLVEDNSFAYIEDGQVKGMIFTYGQNMVLAFDSEMIGFGLLHALKPDTYMIEVDDTNPSLWNFVDHLEVEEAAPDVITYRLL